MLTYLFQTYCIILFPAIYYTTCARSQRKEYSLSVDRLIDQIHFTLLYVINFISINTFDLKVKRPAGVVFLLAFLRVIVVVVTH